MTLERIIQKVKIYTKIDDIFKITRKPEYIRARSLIYYIAWREGYKKIDIARHFNKDHTTILHHLELITWEVDNDRSLDSEFLNGGYKDYLLCGDSFKIINLY